MAKKTSKLILFGLVAGATAAGVYHYLQNKNKQNEDIDEFDDLDNFDDIDTEEPEKSRNYVSLDTAKAFVNDTLDKAKDAISKVSQKLQNSFDESAELEDDDFDVLDADLEEVAAEEVQEEKAIEASKEDVATEESADDATDSEEETTEEFFDDDEE